MIRTLTHSAGPAFIVLCCVAALLANVSTERAAAQNTPAAIHDKGAAQFADKEAPRINWRTALLYAAPVRLSTPADGARSVVLHQPAPPGPVHSAAHGDHRVRPAAHPHRSILFSDSVTQTTDHMQPPLRQDRWLAYDKAQHFVVSFLWTLASQYFFVAKLGMSEGTALPLSMLSSASAGAAKEIYDWRNPDEQTASMRDLAADAAGIVVAGGVILL